jgi:carbonic anhydrase
MRRTALIAGLLAAALAFAPRHHPPRAQPAPAERRPGDGTEWGYAGPGGPEHWAGLSADYKVCATGNQESPIDLRGAIPAKLGDLLIEWRPLPLRVTNTGHSVQVDAPPGSRLSMGGRAYELLQFHLHHPSEHLLDGRRFPMEIHFVHRGPGGDALGVVGVFVEHGAHNEALEAVLANMPAEAGASREAPAGAVVQPHRLLPAGREFLRYEGSLTTPPCSENVDWAVLTQPIQASPAQVSAFERLYANNARPLQPLNRRFLLRSER